MLEKTIKVGEMVNVYIATEDCFVLERSDGEIVNIQNYSKMIKLREGKKNEHPE